jgi:sugar phosphate isomerase/epimerase
MKLTQVAAQLYTLRDFLKTPADIAVTLKKVRAIGYTAIQESGLGPIDEKEWLALLKGEGLTNCGTHDDSQLLLAEPQKVVDRLQRLGLTYSAYPYPGGVELKTLADIESLAKKLDQAGAVFAKAGKVLLYHNHALEFRRFGDKTMLEIIYDNTDPANLQGEIDTYWVQAGGGDPVAWCKRLKNRLPLLHMKDFGINNDGKAYFAEIGHGNLNFKAIVKEAEASGCKWFIVEQDTCPGDPFDSLKKSFEYISHNLVSE